MLSYSSGIQGDCFDESVGVLRLDRCHAGAPTQGPLHLRPRLEAGAAAPSLGDPVFFPSPACVHRHLAVRICGRPLLALLRTNVTPGVTLVPAKLPCPARRAFGATLLLSGR